MGLNPPTIEPPAGRGSMGVDPSTIEPPAGASHMSHQQDKYVQDLPAGGEGPAILWSVLQELAA